MFFKDVELVCPRCHGELAYAQGASNRIDCQECGSIYPVVLDIPDFRIFPDPYIDSAADIAKGKQLADHDQDFDFAGFVGYYYQHTQVVPAQDAGRYTRGILSAESRSQVALQVWENGYPSQDSDSLRFLEIGCGTGSLLQSAAPKYRQVVGVDIAFRWLVVGRKRLQMAGLDLPLICACAEALPFPAGSFDRVAAESTIEHVKDQAKVIDESWRILSPQGQIWLSTPNRLSLGPDPQLGIWAGGYRSKSSIAKIARQRGAVPPVRHLLSAGDLISLLIQGEFNIPELFLMEIPRQQRNQFSPGMRRVIDLYSTIKQVAIFHRFLLRFGPLFYAVAQKRNADRKP